MSLTNSRSLERASLGLPFRLRTLLNLLLIVAGTLLLALCLLWNRAHQQQLEAQKRYPVNPRNLVFADEQNDLPRPAIPQSVMNDSSQSEWDLAQKEIATLQDLKSKAPLFAYLSCRSKLCADCVWVASEKIAAKALRFFVTGRVPWL